MPRSLKRCLFLTCVLAVVATGAGCSSYQVTKDVWKSTKSMWNEYLSPPASIDYSEKGELSPNDLALVEGMMGIDVQLRKLERFMINADKPPTRGWMAQFFSDLPWIDGFAGVRADGSLLGYEPAPGKTPMTLNYNRLLYEPPKQTSRATRCDVQMTANGPAVVVAAPLYDGVDFLGVVACNFSMSTLAPLAKDAQSIVILTPYALLWSGKYDYASTPMAGINWEEASSKASHGTVSNALGSFVYQVRYLGNLPIVFAVATSGAFPEGHTDPARCEQFFAKREDVPPPPQKPRAEQPAQGNEFVPPAPGSEATPGQPGVHDLTPGSNQSILLQEQGAAPMSQGQVRERRLEGEDVPYQPRPQKRQQRRRVPIIIPDIPEEEPTPPPQIVIPSPFGPRPAQPTDGTTPPDSAAPSTEQTPASTPTPETTPTTEPEQSSAPLAPALLPDGRPSPFGPRQAQPEPEPEEQPATLPGGRPSPFGPRQTEPAPAPSTPAPAATPAETAPAPATPAPTAASPTPAATPATPSTPAPAAASSTPAAKAEPVSTPSTAPASEASPAPASTPATLPGGRPSPFGPRTE